MLEQGSGAAVLRIWEDAAAVRPERRGSAIVASAAGEPLAVVDAQPVGRRDRRLLDLRRALIGEAIEARGNCPACAATVEASFAVHDLLAAAPDEAPSSFEFEHDGLRLTVRAPTAGELASLAAEHRHGDAEAARAALLALCVEHCETAAGKPAQVPADAAATVAEAVEGLDPLGAIVFSLTCPECGAAFETPFDPPAFVWQELSTAASRLLWEVDQLARAYGWREADILALSPMRRRAYLEIAAG